MKISNYRTICFLSTAIHILSGVSLLFIFLMMLISPKTVFIGAQKGLLLWFRTVFPTLFPFMLISSMMVSSDSLSYISSIFGKILSAFFSTSQKGAFVIITGFLCGYPMGAKTAADLVRTGSISKEEGAYLLSFCNNISPAFIINYIVWKTLDNEKLILPSLCILIGIPIILSFFFRKIYLKGKTKFSDIRQNAINEKRSLNFAMLDQCLFESYEAIVKIGLYIIFFSILISLLTDKAAAFPFLTILLPWLEITNGIQLAGQYGTDLACSYPLILGITSFGGLCAVAQTKCMLSGSGLKIVPYFAQKLAAAAAASLIGYIYIRLL